MTLAAGQELEDGGILRAEWSQVTDTAVVLTAISRERQLWTVPAPQDDSDPLLLPVCTGLAY